MDNDLGLIISQMPDGESFKVSEWQRFFEELLGYGIDTQGVMTPRGGLTLNAGSVLTPDQEEALLGLFDKFEGESKHYLIAVLGRLGGAKSAKFISDIVMKPANGIDEDTMGVCAQSLWRLGGCDALNALIFLILIDKKPESDSKSGPIASGLASAYAVQRRDMEKNLPPPFHDIFPISLSDLEPIDMKFGCDIIKHTDWKKVLEAAHLGSPERTRAALMRTLGVIEVPMRGGLFDADHVTETPEWRAAKRDFLYAVQPKRLEHVEL